MRVHGTCGKCGKGYRRNSNVNQARPGLCRDCTSTAYEPCVDCGTPRRARDINSGQSCRECLRRRRVEEAELREAARVDWAAVEWVAEGARPVGELTATERQLIVRKVWHRLLPDTVWYNAGPGFVTASQLGARMGVTGDAVTAIRNRLPAATEALCPQCRGPMWIRHEGTEARDLTTRARVAGIGLVEEHGDGFLNRCAMSDRLGRTVVALHGVPQVLLVLRCYALVAS